MKKAIVYYSLTGNTDYVAKKIAFKISADLIRLYPVKECPDKGFKKYFWNGKAAVMKESPKLQKYTFDASLYDEIIIGSPVWASNITPPIRTFINENKEALKNKKISVFLCFSGGGDIKTLDKLKNELNIESFNNQISIIDPKDKKTDEKEKTIDNYIKKMLKE